MELDRKAFLDALKTAAPALATDTHLPKLRMFFFNGMIVRATDGVIGIVSPCQTAFTGGLPGTVLLGFIESLERDTLKAETRDNTVTFVCGGARIKLPLEPLGEGVWPFTIHNAPAEAEIELSAEWRQALAFAMTSVTNNTAQNEQRGITFIPGSKRLNLYSTDNTTMSWAAMPKDGWTDFGLERICVPGDFVRETLRLMPEGGEMHIRETSIESRNEAGVVVYSKLFELPENPINYGQILQRHLNGIELVALPDGLDTALERAELLKDNKDGIPAKLTFTDKDILVVEAHSSFGDLKEELYTEGSHPEVSAHFTPSMLLRGISEGRDSFAVSDRCVVLSGPEHLTYLVSAYRGVK